MTLLTVTLSHGGRDRGQGTVSPDITLTGGVEKVMHLNHLRWQTDLSIRANRQLIKVRASLGLIPCRGAETEAAVDFFNLMVFARDYTGSSPGCRLSRAVDQQSIKFNLGRRKLQGYRTGAHLVCVVRFPPRIGNRAGADLLVFMFIDKP